MIKKVVIGKSMEIIRKNDPKYSEEELEKIKYGLEAIYLSVTKIVAIIVLSIILGSFKETMILLILFNILRLTGFGLHATKSWMCWVSSIPCFVLIPLLCKYIQIPHIITIVIGSISLILLALFAPADTIKRPLIRKKRRIIYKALTIIISIIYLVLIITLKSSFWQSTICFAMLIEAVLTNPMTYKIFKLSYNNYKNYRL